MNLMRMIFGFFIFKSIFHKAQPCNIENNYYYCDDCDDYDTGNGFEDCYDFSFDLGDLFDLY